MTAPTSMDMHSAATELRAAIADHDRLCREVGGDLRTGETGAEAAHKMALLKAHAASTALHPNRKVKEHEVAAEEASFAEWARLTALQYELRACREKMHSLRQVLSAYQTQARTESAA